MSEEEVSPIRPQSVPLSHVERPPGSSSASMPRIPVRSIVVILAITLLLFVVFVLVPGWIGPSEVESRPGVVSTPDEPTSTAPDSDEQLPPFEALMREQAREKAQEELAKFVELQLALEERMQVGIWGQVAFDEAKTLATRGDEQFVADEFEQSLVSYRSASQALTELIAQGEGLLSEALETGERALDRRDQTTASNQFNRALAIDPDNEQAEQGLVRAAHLPEIISLMRKARNHELSDDWLAALATYDQVRALDPKTAGLSDARKAAASGAENLRFREYLSKGFSAMDAGRYEDARSAFNKALALKPADPIALGGLEQVSERTDLSKIDRLKKQAEDAVAAENWQTALERYDEVLGLDSNIQFARDGRALASKQYRTQVTLGNIITAPDKLSSPSLFNQAKDILAEANRLTPRGPRLAEQLLEVERLIGAYSTPVAVTFHSDNATQITLSTIGRLGAFSEKQLSLRPGAYTLIGSRDGCRDVRANILVRPDMEPVDIRCTEKF